MARQALRGCIEAGGTKFVVGLLDDDQNILESARFDTLSPDETIGACVKWLRDASARHGLLASIGIASFGPLELNKSLPDWGHLKSTPKPGWSNADLVGPFVRAFGVPVAIDTDVNGAALAESRWGAAQGMALSVYVTVGTGIGGGAVLNGKPLHGLSHPEMGHIRPQRHAADSDFAGICPFHGDCLEGLASGPAIKARWGLSLSELPTDHIGHEVIAWYLAQLTLNLQAMMEPGRIVLGGGVTATAGLIDKVRECASALGGGYFRGDAREIITLPGLGDRAGLLGALALAMDPA